MQRMRNCLLDLAYRLFEVPCEIDSPSRFHGFQPALGTATNCFLLIEMDGEDPSGMFLPRRLGRWSLVTRQSQVLMYPQQREIM